MRKVLEAHDATIADQVLIKLADKVAAKHTAVVKD
jgi:hypothetical protein